MIIDEMTTTDKIEHYKNLLKLEQTTLESVTEQRDRLAEEIENLKASGIHTCHDQCKRPMCAMRRQRDGLAEALREIKNELGVPQPEYPAPVANAVRIAEQALAAVEGGES
jgi:seryl-tRNA synthetase